MRQKDGNISVVFEDCSEEQYKILGETLKKIRTSRGVTQEELSEMTYKHRTGISGYERGKKVPPIESLYEIANALDYNLNIQFEDKLPNGEVKKEDIVVFTDEYINDFMKRMKMPKTKESNLLRDINGESANWSIESIEKGRVKIVSDRGGEIEISTQFYSQNNNYKRFAPVWINACENSKIPYKNIGFIESYIDLNNQFTLDDMSEIGIAVRKFIALEEILDVCKAYNEFEQHFDIEKMKEYSYDANMTLKRVYKFSDEDIVELINGMYPKYKGLKCLELLNRNQEVAKKEAKDLEEALHLTSACIACNYVTLDIAKKIKKLANCFKIADALSLLLNNPYKIGTEYDITNKEITESEEDGPLCYRLVHDEVDELMIECIKDLNNMKDRDEFVTIDCIISSMLSVFNTNIKEEFATMVILDCIRDVEKMECIEKENKDMKLKPKFKVSTIFMTAGIEACYRENAGLLKECLDRHFLNQSDSCKEDIGYNEEAIKSKIGRVFSMFDTSIGKIFIETGDLAYSDSDDEELYYTTIMMESEY